MATPNEIRQAVLGVTGQGSLLRGLLAYEVPSGRLKLIDGHLRRDIDPDMEVDVEVLDVSDEEARTLLLSIDPLAELAEEQEQLRQRLTELAPPVPPELTEAWQAAAEACLAPPPAGRGRAARGWWSSGTCWWSAATRSSRWSCWRASRPRGWCARPSCPNVAGWVATRRRRLGPWL